MSFSLRPPGFRQRPYYNGYTLIEVIIAMAVFTSIVMLSTMAINQGLKQYHGLMERGINFWDNARSLWANKSFNSVTDYYVYTEKSKWFPYFYGSQDFVSYASLSPLVGDTPVVVWLWNEKQDNGRRSLVYYELPLYTMSYDEIERAGIFGDYKKGQSIKLLENVETIEIRFYGYDFYDRRYSWADNFDGSKKKVLPSLVKIIYTDGGGKNMLVFGINTNSVMKRLYDGVYQGF